ncbi:MAG: cytochrome c [Geminicoccaceae bacterium]
MRPARKEWPAMSRKALLGVSVMAAALAIGPATAQAQDQDETPLITPDQMALLRAEPLASPGDVAATPERLFLGNCASCHGTGKVGNGEPERLTQVVLHGVHRGEAGNVSMPGFEASMTDAQVAGLVAYLSEAKTGTPVEVSAEAVARARTEQQAILKPAGE